jgi:hypothetical protein
VHDSFLVRRFERFGDLRPETLPSALGKTSTGSRASSAKRHCWRRSTNHAQTGAIYGLDEHEGMRLDRQRSLFAA